MDPRTLRLPRSGARYSPILERLLAAKWAGYRFFHEWADLTSIEQAFLIAAYRTEARLAAAEQQHSARKTK